MSSNYLTCVEDTSTPVLSTLRWIYDSSGTLYWVELDEPNSYTGHEQFYTTSPTDVGHLRICN
jgi:hypothetical protein